MPDDDDRETSSQFRERNKIERLLIYLALALALLCHAHEAKDLLHAWNGEPTAEAHSEVAQPTPGKVVLSP